METASASFFGISQILKALEKIEDLGKSDDLAKRCRQAAKSRFNLEKVGGMKYRLYIESFCEAKS